MRGLKHGAARLFYLAAGALGRAIRPAYEGIETSSYTRYRGRIVLPRRAIRPAYEGIETLPQATCEGSVFYTANSIFSTSCN